MTPEQARAIAICVELVDRMLPRHKRDGGPWVLLNGEYCKSTEVNAAPTVLKTMLKDAGLAPKDADYG